MVETSEQSVKPIPSPLETLWANADERWDMAGIGAQKKTKQQKKEQWQQWQWSWTQLKSKNICAETQIK